MLIYYRFFI